MMDLSRENENNFSFWFPKVKNCGIPVPKTRFAKVPAREQEPKFTDRLYQAFYMEHPTDDMAVIQEWIDRFVLMDLMKEGLTGHLFVKNARFSNKFDARGSCNIWGLSELARAIANINYAAMCCDADGVDEIVVREFIESDSRRTPCIYNGLPLRPEFRVFYDFDKNGVIFTANYWDFDYVYPHLHDATDRIIFSHERDRINAAYLGDRRRVQEMVWAAMQRVHGLTGQWSVDILMDEQDNLWLIDMAIAQRSSYWELRPDKETYQ